MYHCISYITFICVHILNNPLIMSDNMDHGSIYMAFLITQCTYNMCRKSLMNFEMFDIFDDIIETKRTIGVWTLVQNDFCMDFSYMLPA